MSSIRSAIWLFIATIAALLANFAVSRYAPASHTAKNMTFFDSGFTPVRITVERRGMPRTVLVREGGWRFAAPYSGSADGQAVNRLLDSLVFAVSEESYSQAELLKLGRTLDDFGLDDPAVSVELYDGSESVKMSFGVFVPATNGVYAIVGGTSDVHVLPASARQVADVDAEMFRERTIFRFGPESVSSFSLKRFGGAPLELVREGGVWRIGDAAAAPGRVSEFLSLACGLKAAGFVWPTASSNETGAAAASLVPQSSYGFEAEGAISLLLRCADGMEGTLVLGNDAGSSRLVYALVHAGSEVVTVDSAIKELSRHDKAYFTDARLFPLAETEVSSFSIADGGILYSVARSADGGWRMDSPVVAPADSETVNAVLGRILALTVADSSKVGGLFVNVSVNTNMSPQKVSSAAVADGIQLASLRSLDVLKIDPALVKRVVSVRSGKSAGKPVSAVRDPDRKAWNAESGEAGGTGGSVDGKTLAAVLDALNPLRAKKVVTLKATPADLAGYGLEKPSLILSIDQETEGSVRRNIIVGDKTDGGRFATVGSSDAIFVLPEKTANVLAKPIAVE